jgi:hypothetical protein
VLIPHFEEEDGGVSNGSDRINLNLVLNKVLVFLHRLSIRDINILILKLIVRMFRTNVN